MNIDELELAKAARDISRGFGRIAAMLEGKMRVKIPRRTDSKEPMSLEQFVKSCKQDSTNRNIHLIGDWANIVKPEINTKGQWRVFIKRHVRDAQELAEFTNEQIFEGFRKMQEGKIPKPTMRTVIKYIT